jgi:hypothetical protein
MLPKEVRERMRRLDKQRKIIIRKIVPIFKGWPINDALNGLEYAKGYISDFGLIQLPPAQSGQKENGK